MTARGGTPPQDQGSQLSTGGFPVDLDNPPPIPPHGELNPPPSRKQSRHLRPPSPLDGDEWLSLEIIAAVFTIPIGYPSFPGPFFEEFSTPFSFPSYALQQLLLSNVGTFRYRCRCAPPPLTRVSCFHQKRPCKLVVASCAPFLVPQVNVSRPPSTFWGFPAFVGYTANEDRLDSPVVGSRLRFLFMEPHPAPISHRAPPCFPSSAEIGRRLVRFLRFVRPCVFSALL